MVSRNRHKRNTTVRLWELLTPGSNVVDGWEIERCRILGPAVILLESGEIGHNQLFAFGGRKAMEVCVFDPAREPQPAGVIVLRNVKITYSSLENIGIAMTIDQMPTWFGGVADGGELPA